jgi:hypothetical protein
MQKKSLKSRSGNLLYFTLFSDYNYFILQTRREYEVPSPDNVHRPDRELRKHKTGRAAVVPAGIDRHMKNVTQLTLDGDNGEAYFYNIITTIS